jgi:ABC-type sugar transport system substrate-binding protein
VKPFLAAIILGLFLTHIPSPALGADAVRTPSVMFFSPADVADRPFWRMFFGFMRVAADDLGLDLRIIPSDNRFLVPKNARAALAEEVPDYAIYVYQAKITVDLLPLLERAGVKSIICNTRPVESEQAEVGRPMERFAHWIGQISPYDREAGYLSARLLIEQGLALGLTAPDGKLHMAGLGAYEVISSASLRKQGMEEAVAKESRAVVDRFAIADWQRAKARYKAERMLDMYPLAHAYWAASDSMALGALDAARAQGLTPSVDFLTIGVDWTEEGIRAVREGEMLATVGGHFMEGAWALIMALDHYNGHGFTQPIQRSHMKAITRGNLDAYRPVLTQDNWKRIDFKQFARTYNPDLAAYDFTPEAVLRQLTGK